MRSVREIGLLGAVALLALRLAIGWHFYQEGVAKVNGKFSSAGFLANAKGPLAPYYEQLIWDVDGRHRLHGPPTIEAWEKYRDYAAGHFGFDEGQEADADAIFQRYKTQFETYLKTNDADMEEYLNGLDRRDRYRGLSEEEDAGKKTALRQWTEVPSLRGQLNAISAELKKKRDGWLKTIDQLWAGYEKEINEIPDEDQRRYGYLPLPKTGRRPLDSLTIDRIIPYFDLAIGVMLMLGLFTRLAGVLGAAFLGSVVLSQWPLAPDAAPTYYQTIEMLALLALAGCGAGRIAGLDALFAAATSKCCPPKQES